jgi:S1-C subfamily serine protease
MFYMSVYEHFQVFPCFSRASRSLTILHPKSKLSYSPINQHTMAVIKASAVKKPGLKYGIAFSRKTPESPLTIRTVRDESPFASKGLVQGMVVTKVNGEDMTWLGPREAAKVLQKAKLGTTMTVEAATSYVAEARKGRKKTKCGVWLKNSTKAPGVFVSRVNEEGLFADSKIESGMKVVQVNGKPCFDDLDFHQAINMLKKSSGFVEIVAIDTIYRGKMTTPSSPQKRKSRFSGRPRLVATSSDEDSVDKDKPLLEKLFPMLVDLQTSNKGYNS